MDINFHLEDLSLEDIGIWPQTVKIFLVALLVVLLLIFGYWFDTQDGLNQLSEVRQHELELRQQFEVKQQQAVNLPEYRVQLAQIRISLNAMLRQLPVSTEVPGLLEDISKTGVASGLEFELFRPLPEKQADFYSELPIEISVAGGYHQLARFVSKISALDRIVTLHDFNISIEKDAGKQSNAAANSSSNRKGGVEQLVMDVTAMTYRYLQDHKETLKQDGHQTNETQSKG